MSMWNVRALEKNKCSHEHNTPSVKKAATGEIISVKLKACWPPRSEWLCGYPSGMTHCDKYGNETYEVIAPHIDVYSIFMLALL